MKRICEECRIKESEKGRKGYTVCVVFEKVKTKDECDFCKKEVEK